MAGKSKKKIAILAIVLVIGVLVLLLKDGAYIKRSNTFVGDSAELNSTVIVPTLDSPMPNARNVIWCSSVQLAWNELKDDIIKEPILLSENQEIADLLNQAKQSKQDVSENDYYAHAGFVKDGVIETIQSEMARQFPDEPVPSFEDVTPLTAVISYSYLTANVEFTTPYFENNKEFLFTDSEGSITAITSFGIRKEDRYAYRKLRRQAYALFDQTKIDEMNGQYDVIECAIDLCKNSSPYQVVIAMVEPKETLSKTIVYVDEQCREASQKKYSHMLGPNDVLLVPNLFWKIAHSYEELEGKTLQNLGYAGMPIVKAEQVIQFRLDRSGANLKSLFSQVVLPTPTHYVFDRPFLIYMKKRGAEHPFFAMWVDNAELLEKY